MIKKIFKTLGIILVILLAILAIIPLFLESKIDTIVKNYAEENLQAELRFDDIDLSLISSFPQAQLAIQNIEIVNRAPFNDEVLLTAKTLSVELPMLQLISQGDDPLTITEIFAQEFLLSLKINKNGATNYDILKTASTTDSETSTSSQKESFSFDIRNYEIENSAIHFINEAADFNLSVTNLNHQGEGSFTSNSSLLDTKTNAQLTITSDSTTYIANNDIRLDAVIDMDLDNETYTFKDNSGYINALPITFDGYIKILEDGQELDMSFKNPKSSFKSFFELFPQRYAKNINQLNTEGDFTLNGFVRGVYSDATIPTFNVRLQSQNAAFKYDDLPKKVEQINIDAVLKNTTGITEDTELDINQLSFKIDKDQFNSQLHIRQLTTNMKVEAQLDGVLNLAHLSQSYPLDLQQQLSGILVADVNTNFDMDAIENKAYKRVKSSGQLELTNMVFSLDEMKHPIQINTADLQFAPERIRLNQFEMVTGESDMKITGTLENLVGFFLKDQQLKGEFDLNAKKLVIADLLTKAEDNPNDVNTEKTSSPQIPKFLDCRFVGNAATVIYDDIALENVTAELTIKDQVVNLKNVSSDLFGGRLVATGLVDTKTNEPKFEMNLNMDAFDIAKSFTELNVLQALAPIANVLTGKINTDLSFSGLLNDNFAPQLNSINGSAFAQLFNTSLNAENSPMLKTLSQKVNFLEPEQLELNDVKANLSFENGGVALQPFTVYVKDIPLDVSGTHNFNNTLNYDVTMQVPSKYLGAEVNRLIGQINDEDVNNITVPVTSHITGTFKNPEVTTDLSESVSNFTQQLIEIQKKKLINKGSGAVTDALEGLFNNKESDSTQSSKNENTIKKTVESVFDKFVKKKNTSTKKDSIAENQN